MAKDKADTREKVFEVVSRATPGTSAPDVADEIGVTDPTARSHLKGLVEDGEVDAAEFGNTTVYFTETEILPGPDEVDETIGFAPDEREMAADTRLGWQLRGVVNEFTDRFVGLDREPWTAIHPNDGPATAGDRIQIHVEGLPENWGVVLEQVPEEEAREYLTEPEVVRGEVSVLLSGTLYAKPTTPIEHHSIPEDYDLEGRQNLSPWLFEPCNEAVFLEDVEVDWISPIGYPQMETTPV